jgi:hypothetical protein
MTQIEVERVILSDIAQTRVQYRICAVDFRSIIFQ